jgi:N-acyl-D-aspartate/D-glutamate deacylase
VATLLPDPEPRARAVTIISVDDHLIEPAQTFEGRRRVGLVVLPVAGVRDRGRVAEGAWADLVAFDPATVGPSPERTVDDLPGGVGRLTADATGFEHVIVAGTTIAGAFTGAQPGKVLRSAIDTVTVP